MKSLIKISYKIIKIHKEKLFSILVLAILICGVAYGFMLKSTIDNVVEREKMSKESKNMLAEISDLETKYFSLKNSVTVEVAYAKGFKNPKNTSYISGKSITAMISKNEF